MNIEWTFETGVSHEFIHLRTVPSGNTVSPMEALFKRCSRTVFMAILRYLIWANYYSFVNLNVSAILGGFGDPKPTCCCKCCCKLKPHKNWWLWRCWTELLDNQLHNVEPSSSNHIMNQKKQIINQRDYGETSVMVLIFNFNPNKSKINLKQHWKNAHTHNIYIYMCIFHPHFHFLGAKKLVSPDPASSMSSWFFFMAWHGIKRSASFAISNDFKAGEKK